VRAFQVFWRTALYPYARLDRDSLSRKPVLVRYESLTLENEYLRVILLPELGGRIWAARDKVADRDIFYYTSVIKPTSYNQRGGWPVGNLEVYGPYDAHMLTWPGEPWPWAFKQHSDGSATVILSHIDHFFRNKLAMNVTCIRVHRSLSSRYDCATITPCRTVTCCGPMPEFARPMERASFIR
jgi:hypothetical protein